MIIKATLETYSRLHVLSDDKDDPAVHSFAIRLAEGELVSTYEGGTLYVEGTALGTVHAIDSDYVDVWDSDGFVGVVNERTKLVVGLDTEAFKRA